VNGLFPDGPAGTAATWVGAMATIVVFARMVGERRLSALAQHLLAGLATGYLALLVLHEVIVPRLLVPLADAPAARPELWIGLGVVALTVGSAWLPRRVAAMPMGLLVGSLAAFALGGAVIGTILPQLGAGIVTAGDGPAVANRLLALAITVVVMVGFIHGMPRGRALDGTATAGRWLLIGGIGAWLGFLLVTRLALLLDRLAFLAFDWIGIGR